MYHIKRISPRRTSVDYYKVIYAVQSFLALDFFVKKNVSNISDLCNFQVMVV